MVNSEGWWHCPNRVLYVGQDSANEATPKEYTGLHHGDSRPVLITGATGTLGRALARLCEFRGLEFRLVSRQQMDICDAGSISRLLDALKPWAVINAAGYVRVDEAEKESEKCRRANIDGPVLLAEACKERGISLLNFSSDLVFSGLVRPIRQETHPREARRPAPSARWRAKGATC